MAEGVSLRVDAGVGKLWTREFGPSRHISTRGGSGAWVSVCVQAEALVGADATRSHTRLSMNCTAAR
eukprot:2735162-Pleurochrysis_carterae.AAC.1